MKRQQPEWSLQRADAGRSMILPEITSPPDDATERAPIKLDQPEHRFSHWVNALLERIVLEPAWYTAVDHSGPVGQKGETPDQRRIKRLRWEQRQRMMGIKPSQLDWPAVVQFDPETFAVAAICWIELKRGDNDPTPGQEVTIRLLRERGQIAEPAWDIADVLAILRRARFRLHGNADNIAVEIAAKLDAADRTARAKIAAPRKPKAGKPRAPKPTLTQVRRQNAVRSRVPF